MCREVIWVRPLCSRDVFVCVCVCAHARREGERERERERVIKQTDRGAKHPKRERRGERRGGEIKKYTQMEEEW